MLVYRITRAEFAEDLSGKGAASRGGRWNMKRTPLLYCANSTALAALELRVNIDLDDLPALSRIVLEIPDDLVSTGTPIFFPDWAQSQRVGESWARGCGTLCHNVCSAVLPVAQDAFNVLVNPSHPGMSRLRIKEIGEFVFDSRLI